MNANTNTFIVTRDGEVDKKLSTFEPRRGTLTGLNGGIAGLPSFIQLQTKMAVYDALHGTHYRRIRNRLAARERNQAFEARIGLTRV